MTPEEHEELIAELFGDEEESEDEEEIEYVEQVHERDDDAFEGCARSWSEVPWWQREA